MANPSAASDEFGALLQAVWRRRFVALAMLAAALAGTIFYTSRQPVLYETSAVVLVPQGDGEALLNETSAGRAELERNAANELVYLRSDELRRAIADELGFQPRIDVRAADGDAYVFSTKGPTPNLLPTIVNTGAEVYVQQRAERVITDFVTTIGAVQDRIDQLAAEERALLDPIDEFEASFNPFAVRSDGTLVHSVVEIEAYQRTLDDMEGDAEAELRLLGSSRLNLQRTLDDLVLSSSVQAEAQILRRASVPQNPTSPSWPTNILLGLLGGLVAALGAVIAFESTDDQVRTAKDIQRDDAAPAIIPRMEPTRRQARSHAELVTYENPGSDAAQAFWELAGLIHIHLGDLSEDRTRVILVTSAEPAVGKTFVATNLSYTLAQSGLATVLADVDLRRPTVHRVFDVASSPGVAELLRGENVETESLGSNLTVIPAGDAAGIPTELVAKLEHLEWFVDSSEIAILDSPPLLAAPDAALLCRMCDLVLLVARSGHTSKRDYATAYNRIRAVSDVPVLSVLNAADQNAESYKYSKYYNSTSTTGEKRTRRSARS